jgi:hypothetical protein
MGVSYMSYSCMFVTANIQNVEFEVDLWMNIYHLTILIYLVECCIKTYGKVRNQFELFEVDPEKNFYSTPIEQTLETRRNFINYYSVITFVFCLN